MYAERVHSFAAMALISYSCIDNQISNIKVEPTPVCLSSTRVFLRNKRAGMRGSSLSVCDVTIHSKFSRRDFEF